MSRQDPTTIFELSCWHTVLLWTLLRSFCTYATSRLLQRRQTETRLDTELLKYRRGAMLSGCLFKTVASARWQVVGDERHNPPPAKHWQAPSQSPRVMGRSTNAGGYTDSRNHWYPRETRVLASICNNNAAPSLRTLPMTQKKGV